jgi:UDP-glucose:(heptosyl)LPS alpha-1,3-glucosyltransferase
MIKREIIEDFSVDATKIHVIYNSIDSTRFFPGESAQRAVLRQRLDLPTEAVVFCFVGSGFERKGLASAIQAIAGTPAYLIVVGQDKAEKRYRELANTLGCLKQIRFLGMQKETLPFYQLSDGLLLPTLYDPFPNVILEAMACGLPVITSDSCGGAEFIEQGNNGFFCDALDISALKEAVMTIQSREKNYNMGMAARDKVMDATPERLSSQLISLYQNFMD